MMSDEYYARDKKVGFCANRIAEAARIIMAGRKLYKK